MHILNRFTYPLSLLRLLLVPRFITLARDDILTQRIDLVVDHGCLEGTLGFVFLLQLQDNGVFLIIEHFRNQRHNEVS